MASSLTSVQKTMPCEYWKSTAAASSKPLTTTVDSSFVPPASTSRTSRRLAKSRKGDAAEGKNGNMLASQAPTDVQELTTYVAEDFFSQTGRAGSTEVSPYPNTSSFPMSDRGVKERWKSRPSSLSRGCEKHLPHSEFTSRLFNNTFNNTFCLLF